MRTNFRPSYPVVTTHEGAPAAQINPLQQLRRSVLSCLLWEKEFYEDGQDIATRILETAAKVDAEQVAALAMEARHVHGLRHVPLLLLLDLVRRGGPGVGFTVGHTLRRADEMGELLALYWKNGKRPISAQLKRGLAQAFGKFSEYELAKYNRDGAVKLRDVLFLTRPKPVDEARAKLYRRVADNELATPDTWEVALSGGADKRETFERLIRENKLGYLALIRNLRNMMDAGCDRQLVAQAVIARRGADLVFPFRYVAAARACPQMEPELDQALCEAVASGPHFAGRTVVLVDVSGSMASPLSAKSDLNRMDAAATLASVINGETLRMFSFSNQLVEVPPRRGMAGIDALIRSQSHGGTELGNAIFTINRDIKYDRLIVITDEQASGGRVPDPLPGTKGYVINVASAKNGVGYGPWVHVDGFSEAVIRFIQGVESDR